MKAKNNQTFFFSLIIILNLMFCGQNDILLRYKFKPGDLLVYRLSYDSTIPLSQMLNDQVLTMTLKTQGCFVAGTRTVLGDSAAEILLYRQFEDINDEKFKFDVNKYRLSNLRFLFTSQGALGHQAHQRREDNTIHPDDNSYFDIMSGQLFFFMLPFNPVSPSKKYHKYLHEKYIYDKFVTDTLDYKIYPYNDDTDNALFKIEANGIQSKYTYGSKRLTKENVHATYLFNSLEGKILEGSIAYRHKVKIGETTNSIYYASQSDSFHFALIDSLPSDPGEADNEWLLTFYNIAHAYWGLKNYGEAVKNFTNVIKIDSAYVDAYIMRSMVYEDLENLDAAIEDLSHAIQMAPNDYQLYWRRAPIYEKKGDIKAAVEDYNDYLRLTAGTYNRFIESRRKDFRNKIIAFGYKPKY